MEAAIERVSVVIGMCLVVIVITFSVELYMIFNILNEILRELKRRGPK